MAAMRVPLWLKILWTVWVVIWAPLVLEALRRSELALFLRFGKLLHRDGTLAGEPVALFLAGHRTASIPKSLHHRFNRRGPDRQTHHRWHRIYVRQPGIPLFLRLLSLFHVVTPPLLLWAIQRLGYDRRGWKYQTLTAWVVVPINYFWRPEHDVNWARGPFFREQHVLPGLLYLFLYLILVPLLVYWPTHLALRWWARHTQTQYHPSEVSPSACERAGVVEGSLHPTCAWALEGDAHVCGELLDEQQSLRSG